MRHRGYTLVEMLIATALGAVVVTTAFAAFRVASQSNAIATRLSTENALIRAGLHEAHRELDLWLSYDDPDVAARQALRAGGLPFSVLPASSGGVTGGAPAEAERGFDPRYRWPINDARTWYHGNIGEHDEPRIFEQTFGRYGMFTNEDPTPAFEATPEGKGFAVATPVAHTWLPNQLQMVYDAFGYYGFTEYFPANQVFVPYRSHSASTTHGGMPLDLVRPSSDAASFSNRDGWVGYPRGRFLLSFGSSFAMPRTVERWTDLAAIGGATRRHYETSYLGDKRDLTGGASAASSDYAAFADETENHWAPLALAPAAWPRVEVRAQRFLKDARFVALMRVRWTSPLSGARGELNFTGFGTSLRGARQQRKPGGGWARWIEPGASGNDATLDGAP